ncbi:hypothetical protein CEP52_002055 [Fusarium oligoseptatum]|uniref:Uncharacterized protein n=1 Tax=Fusarium oligoseptatum TaxID=2604345 RepID=A0A428UFR9_9HYPO|nr:hypothetical protein CEP52_002055 [Fusarium oligoseptatum]
MIHAISLVHPRSFPTAPWIIGQWLSRRVVGCLARIHTAEGFVFLQSFNSFTEAIQKLCVTIEGMFN